jgi:hypothetical protein
MFQVFQLFQMYVSSVLYECCKSTSGCCIYCNGCIRMLQVSVPSVSSLFFRRMLQVCLSGCSIYFTHMLQVFYLDVTFVCNSFKVFLSVFASASDVCFKYFICILLYVVSITSECFKSIPRSCAWDACRKLEAARAVSAYGLMTRVTLEATRSPRMV